MSPISPEVDQRLEFGRWLQRAYEQRGFASQGAFAEAAGASSGQMSKWISGKNPPSAKSMRLMARALGVEPLEIYVRAGWLTEGEAHTKLPEREELDPRVSRYRRALALVDRFPNSQRAAAERVAYSIDGLVATIEAMAEPFGGLSKLLGLPGRT